MERRATVLCKRGLSSGAFVGITVALLALGDTARAGAVAGGVEGGAGASGPTPAYSDVFYRRADPTEEVMLTPGNAWQMGLPVAPSDCHVPGGPPCVGVTLGAAMLSAGPRATGVQASVRWLPTPQVAIELGFGRLAAPGLLDFPFLAGTDLFLGGRTFVPYAHVAIGAESLQIDDERATGDVSTFEGQLGGGLELRLSRDWAIDGEIDLVRRRVVQSSVKSTEPPVQVTAFELQTSGGGSTAAQPATVQVESGFAASLSLVAYF